MPATVSGPAPQDPVVARAIEQVRAALPDGAPYKIWRSQEIVDAGDGRRIPIELLILTRGGLWVVHVHPHGGRLQGDADIWLWPDAPGEPILDAPFRQTDELAARVREGLGRYGLGSVVVRPLVLLAADELTIAEQSSLLGRSDLVTLATNAVPNLNSIETLLLADPRRGEAVASRQQEAVEQALRAAGLRDAPVAEVVGGYQFDQRLADHQVWEEYAAARLDDAGHKVRVRRWVLPGLDEAERRQTLERAVLREAEVLRRVGRHPSILSLEDTAEQDGLTSLIFERFEGGVPLHQFLRGFANAQFQPRLEILRLVADAIDHCHRHEVTHRNLSPESVLVRLHPKTGLEVRLHRFDGAVMRQAEATTLATRHLTVLSERIDDLYRAPEVHRNPGAADAASDLFSLGALAYFLFTGHHPDRRASADRRLPEGLCIWKVRDDYDQELEDGVSAATRGSVLDREKAVANWASDILEERRPPTARAWINALLRLYRADADESVVRSPLDAEMGDYLGGGLVMEDILGSGASARVIAVRSDEQLRALKVPRNAHAEGLLDAEAAVLRRLDHPGIVRLDDVVRLSGRPCLLMEHAGNETLGDLVRRQGTLALDYVQRLGTELLDALTHLHERGITHRDIKPGNLAFTSVGKQAHRLLLFDFSLAAYPAHQTETGTPAWRDPLLQDRGQWDAAADLYAAAAVLHYALTGERPTWKERERATRIAESRFDPDLRGRLTRFFGKAFAAEVGQRFQDTAEMRAAWGEVFAGGKTELPVVDDRFLDPRFERARLDSPIGALGLSARALNALERAGVANVRDLLGLPQNRLSLVRGVGRETTEEIVRAAEALRNRLGTRDDAAVTPFLEGPSLPNIAIEAGELPLTPQAAKALIDAGIATLRDLAEAGAERVERLLEPHGIDTRALRSALRPPEAGELGDWLRALLRPNRGSKRTAWEKRAGALLGLDPLPDAADEAPAGGRTNAAVAAALGDTPVRFRASFQSARTHWDRDPAVRDQAIAAIGAALDRVGPVAPIPEVAEAMIQAVAPAQRGDARTQRHAVALVRFGTEVGIPRPPFTWRRLGSHAWLARTDAALDALQALARAAERLAANQPVAQEDALGELRAAAAPPLDALEPEVLLERVAAASDKVALSPRLELYPRGLPAHRAVELSAAVLTGPLAPDEIRRRVATRYPDAEPLPERPELDTLLGRLGLRWSADARSFVRPGATAVTVSNPWATSAASLLTARGRREPAQHRADQFADSLARGLETGRFRVIQVSARRAEEAVTALRGHVPRLVVESLDTAVWTALNAKIQEAGADLDFVLGVDGAGPAGPHWELFLTRFVGPVVDAVVDDILARRADHPMLLLHPGLFARYGQVVALRRLVTGAEDDEGAAVWLLLPSWDDGGKPLIRHPLGDLPLPIYKPAQRLRAPRGWISRTVGPP